jgi:type I restriction-modification system DNA methylase subunit
MRREEALKAFKTSFERLSYTRSYGSVFNDFLDFALWSLNINKDQKAYDEVKHLDKEYKEKEAPLMADMLKYWSYAADNDGVGFYDALGDIFMTCVSHGKNGQYFTPDPITDFMAAIVAVDELKDGQKVCDPACGSGRMLLSAGKRNRNALFYGSDLDVTCCKMAVLNMVTNTLCGEIAHMDALSMEHFKSWHISKVQNDKGFWLPYYYTTGAGETTFISRLKNTMKQQETEPKTAGKAVFRDVEHQPTGNQLALF